MSARRALGLAWVFAFFLVACTPSVASVPRTVVSLAKLDCADCGLKLAHDIAARPGVQQARFDRRRSELVVLAEPGFDVLAAARELAKGEAYELVLGAGQGSYLPAPPIPSELDVVWLVRDGADLADLASHRATDKVTVMEFGAVWCEPCRAVDAHMVALLGSRKDVAYRKLDVGDWDSALARHHLVGASALPFIVVFGKDGRQVDSFGGLDLARLDRAIAAGATR